MLKRFEQPVVVDLRPGADTIIGDAACAKSAPDGYTFCMLPLDSLVLNPILFKKLRVKALAIDSTVRSPMLPEIPTFRESGSVGGVPLRAWFGIVAPKGTPAAIIARLNA